MTEEAKHTADYADIISRLESAEGPDRELDGDIWFAVHGYRASANLENYPSRYTASIDAAMTLVPDGFQAYVDTGIGHGDAHACVWTDHPCRIQGGARQQHSPAIALCIAALKARALTQPKENA